MFTTEECKMIFPVIKKKVEAYDKTCWWGKQKRTNEDIIKFSYVCKVIDLEVYASLMGNLEKL